MNYHLRKGILLLFFVLAGASLYYATQLKFTFSFDQFFPEGDEDLAFYQEFEAHFEQDVNFLLVALPREHGVFDSTFLRKVKDFTLEALQLPLVTESQSLTTIRRPLKTPFAITTIPFIHIDKPAQYQRDKERILQDERLVNTLIDEEAKVLVVAMKTNAGTMNIDKSTQLIQSVEALLEHHDFDRYHLLGSAYFAKEMVRMQKREVLVTSVISGILVSFIMFMIFRRFWGMVLALVSIALGMLLFMGFMGASGRPLNAMAALYPMLMIIVGTSDVIHIMTKYIDELRQGKDRDEAIRISIREIGLATLLTSLTTAIGFFALSTSKITPIQAFGINAAVGVMIAYVTVLLFTTAVLSFFRTDQLIKVGTTNSNWDQLMNWTNRLTIHHRKTITGISIFIFVLSLIGISMITTNYRIENNLPLNEKLTEDFFFFEERLAGFRPIEMVVFAQGDYKADDFEVVKEIDRVEQYLRTIPHLESIQSITALYKSIHQMHKNNAPEAYQLPDNKDAFLAYRKMASKVSGSTDKVLLSKDKKMARISIRAKDIGADRIRESGEEVDRWIKQHADTTVAIFKETGTGLLMDKNGDHVRKNLLEGLAMAVCIISLLMALLFRSWQMVIISLVPNVFPLVLAGAMLGYMGIELDAGISIIFAIIFGIAVDDTIHFLSKFKLSIYKGYTIEDAISITFRETGKAICLTSIVLFFGFLVLLTSIHPPSVTIGIMISITLISAVVGDLLLIPVLIRWLLKDDALAKT